MVVVEWLSAEWLRGQNGWEALYDVVQNENGCLVTVLNRPSKLQQMTILPPNVMYQKNHLISLENLLETKSISTMKGENPDGVTYNRFHHKRRPKIDSTMKGENPDGFAREKRGRTSRRKNDFNPEKRIQPR